MSNLQEVPTEELLSFQDYPTVHNNTTIPIVEPQSTFRQDNNFNDRPNLDSSDPPSTEQPPVKAFWTLEYYQKYFDVDTKDVTERILASIIPKWDSNLKHHLRTKPDLYGPFWISITLIFALAISGNVADYLSHANSDYQWKYDFNLVSYAASVISLYVTLVPSLLWGLLKWSTQVQDVEGLTSDLTPGLLELICVYGYSLFIYIPACILWSIRISWLQWALLIVATMISGSVLLLTIMPALRLSRHKLLLSIGIVCCHLLLAVGFMFYFFHMGDEVVPPAATNATNATNILVPKAVNQSVVIPKVEGVITDTVTKTSVHL